MKKYDVKALPGFNKAEKALYEERESGVTHLPFSYELTLCRLIQAGDSKGIDDFYEKTLKREIVVGSLSTDSVSSMKYWAVTTIATAIHYAILGGMDETEAYNFSDECIRTVDGMTDYDSCIDYLFRRSRELADQVEEAVLGADTHRAVKQCLHFIHIHLHEKITTDMLVEETGLCRSYLSVLFKKETGFSVHEYVLTEKLKEAKELLKAGKSSNEVSYILNFCSQSHFIEMFKKEYGMTPYEFKAKG